MGYTHYFEQKAEVEPRRWHDVAARAKRIIDAAPCEIRREYDESEPPTVTADLIRFNGADDAGYETFYLERSSVGFHFCKTDRRPYDAVVVAILLVLDKYAPGCHDIASDGRAASWEAGKALAESALGERFDLPAGVRQ